MLVTRYFARDAYKRKTVFVTGGGSGINLRIGRNFAALGADIAVCGRRQETWTSPPGNCGRSGRMFAPSPPTCAR
jgi:NADP-dependent 3-hydroxy acid dehydrogenase YdfG